MSPLGLPGLLPGVTTTAAPICYARGSPGPHGFKHSDGTTSCTICDTMFDTRTKEQKDEQYKARYETS